MHAMPTVSRANVNPTVPHMPINAVRSMPLRDQDRDHVFRMAQDLSQEQRHLSDVTYFGTEVRSGMGSTPSLLIGDKSEIPLLAPAGSDTLEYRIGLLANADDLILLAGDRNPDFESYMGSLLGLQQMQVLQAEANGNGSALGTAKRCLKDSVLLNRLADRARAHKGATIVPHISTGSIWMLAKRLHDITGEAIYVAGPPPNLTARVNDKIWFADVAARLLGETSVPPRLTAHGSAALTAHVHRLSQVWEKIVVKVPDSAGSAGNFPIESANVRDLGAKALHLDLVRRLSAVTPSKHYPLMVEVWDCNVLSSPSLQMWLPRKSDGDPIMEGVFDQILSGSEGRFVGATMARLPHKWDNRLCTDAMKLALLFQKLGYYGRCSFDAVIAGENYDDANLHWIECNGRWGGVSLPMTFMNRLFSGGPIPPYVIVQLSELDFHPRSFQTALQSLGDRIYRSGGPAHGAVFLTPGGLENGSGLHMLSIGQSTDDAVRRADEVIHALCGSD